MTIVESLNLETRLVGGAERTLGLLGFAHQLLHGTHVLGHVYVGIIVQDVDEGKHNTLIESLSWQVVSFQVGVSGGGHHLEHAIVNGQEGRIEGVSAKLVDQNV